MEWPLNNNTCILTRNGTLDHRLLRAGNTVLHLPSQELQCWLKLPIQILLRFMRWAMEPSSINKHTKKGGYCSGLVESDRRRFKCLLVSSCVGLAHINGCD